MKSLNLQYFSKPTPKHLKTAATGSEANFSRHDSHIPSALSPMLSQAQTVFRMQSQSPVDLMSEGIDLIFKKSGAASPRCFSVAPEIKHSAIPLPDNPIMMLASSKQVLPSHYRSRTMLRVEEGGM
jgi:hypothetical protein